MPLWLELVDRAWQMALLIVPIGFLQYLSARKTRTKNTGEHQMNSEQLKKAVEYSKAASQHAAQANRRVANLDGRLTGYIEEHKQVHSQLRR
jgi:hypothetical protein